MYTASRVTSGRRVAIYHIRMRLLIGRPSSSGYLLSFLRSLNGKGNSNSSLLNNFLEPLPDPSINEKCENLLKESLHSLILPGLP